MTDSTSDPVPNLTQPEPLTDPWFYLRQIPLDEFKELYGFLFRGGREELTTAQIRTRVMKHIALLKTSFQLLLALPFAKPQIPAPDVIRDFHRGLRLVVSYLDPDGEDTDLDNITNLPSAGDKDAFKASLALQPKQRAQEQERKEQEQLRQAQQQKADRKRKRAEEEEAQAKSAADAGKSRQSSRRPRNATPGPSGAVTVSSPFLFEPKGLKVRKEEKRLTNYVSVPASSRPVSFCSFSSPRRSQGRSTELRRRCESGALEGYVRGRVASGGGSAANTRVGDVVRRCGAAVTVTLEWEGTALGTGMVMGRGSEGRGGSLRDEDGRAAVSGLVLGCRVEQRGGVRRGLGLNILNIVEVLRGLKRAQTMEGGRRRRGSGATWRSRAGSATNLRHFDESDWQSMTPNSTQSAPMISSRGIQGGARSIQQTASGSTLLKPKSEEPVSPEVVQLVDPLDVRQQKRVKVPADPPAKYKLRAFDGTLHPWTIQGKEAQYQDLNGDPDEFHLSNARRQAVNTQRYLPAAVPGRPEVVVPVAQQIRISQTQRNHAVHQKHHAKGKPLPAAVLNSLLVYMPQLQRWGLPAEEIELKQIKSRSIYHVFNMSPPVLRSPAHLCISRTARNALRVRSAAGLAPPAGEVWLATTAVSCTAAHCATTPFRGNLRTRLPTPWLLSPARVLVVRFFISLDWNTSLDSLEHSSEALGHAYRTVHSLTREHQYNQLLFLKTVLETRREILNKTMFYERFESKEAAEFVLRVALAQGVTSRTEVTRDFVWHYCRDEDLMQPIPDYASAYDFYEALDASRAQSEGYLNYSQDGEPATWRGDFDSIETERHGDVVIGPNVHKVARRLAEEAGEPVDSSIDLPKDTGFPSSAPASYFAPGLFQHIYDDDIDLEALEASTSQIPLPSSDETDDEDEDMESSGRASSSEESESESNTTPRPDAYSREVSQLQQG
ncbi:hypothetical protein C8R46DRAFT_1051398 [Mycena filopes]|nr:hypothetical protein C8R46DRAFT_1051398 [Mycena filopes]